MSIHFDRIEATAVVHAAAARADAGQLDHAWVAKVARLSRLCEADGSKTHIAMLGTAMLAKAMRLDVDLHAIKPTKARGNPGAYSARILCHSVLVPLAVDLHFSLGVTGREPLNNQPYFRIGRLGDDTPLRRRGAFNHMLELVNELQGLRTREEARTALAAFISERRQHQARYVVPIGETPISTPKELTEAVRSLVWNGAEGGRLAQAVVAGLMDAFAGLERVESGRVNDPSRRHPGDVCVRSADAPSVWEKAFEVRDKPVSISDVQIFGAKCVSMGVREAAVVAVAVGQIPLDRSRLAEWSRDLGIGLTLFEGWESIIEQALFWAGDAKPVAARRAVRRIHQRLVAVEASPAAVDRWARLTGRGVGA